MPLYIQRFVRNIDLQTSVVLCNLKLFLKSSKHTECINVRFFSFFRPANNCIYMIYSKKRYAMRAKGFKNEESSATNRELTFQAIYLKFAFFWLNKGNQYEFLTHPKIKGLDGGLEPPTSALPVHCSTT